MNTETVGVESKTKVLPFEGAGAMNLYRFAFLSVLAIASPLVFSQPVTGSFVNAALFLSAAFFGFRRESFAIATVPSLVALATGQLPAVFMPLVPFIVAGNLLLVYLADRGFRKAEPFVVTAVSAAFAKSALLFAAGSVLFATMLRDFPVADKIPSMFGWLQLATALVGAAIASGVLRMTRFFSR